MLMTTGRVSQAGIPSGGGDDDEESRWMVEETESGPCGALADGKLWYYNSPGLVGASRVTGHYE